MVIVIIKTRINTPIVFPKEIWCDFLSAIIPKIRDQTKEEIKIITNKIVKIENPRIESSKNNSFPEWDIKTTKEIEINPPIMATGKDE